MNNTPKEARRLALAEFRKNSPHLFTAPDFWKSTLDAIEEAAQALKNGTTEVIGHSHGGRPISAFFFGDFEPLHPTTTISSAMASDSSETFYNPSARTRQSLVIIGSIHGGETEGIATCLDLIHILEHQRDLQGQTYPKLNDLLQKFRLTIIPCLNPDGRIAAGVQHLSGGKIEDIFWVQQGVLKDGTLFRGRKVKEIQPISEEMMLHRGGYYNDAGINLQHDDFFGPEIAPENKAVQSVFRREIPDAFLTMHAHGGPAAILTPDSYLTPGAQRKQIEAAGYMLANLAAENIPFTPPDKIVTPPWSFYFQTWLYQMTGATPCLFEFSHGTDYFPQSHQQILHTGKTLVSSWLDYIDRFGARPNSPEMFGSIKAAP